MPLMELAKEHLSLISGGNEDGTSSEQNFRFMHEMQVMALSGFSPFNETAYTAPALDPLPSPPFSQIANLACSSAAGAVSGTILGDMGGLIAGPAGAIAGKLLGGVGGTSIGAAICPQIVNLVSRRQ